MKKTQGLEPIPKSKLPEGWEVLDKSSEKIKYGNEKYHVIISKIKESRFMPYKYRIKYFKNNIVFGSPKYRSRLTQANIVFLKFMRDVNKGRYD